MNPLTPDPKKRGYLLPPGCKDLHDVLQPREHRQPGGGFRWDMANPGGDIKQALANAQAAMRAAGLKRNEELTGRWRLCELVPSLTALSAPEAQFFFLRVSAPERELDVSMHGGQGLVTDVSLWAELGTERNRVVREFCVRHGWPLPQEGPLPLPLRSDLPVSQKYELRPVPGGVAEAASWVRTLYVEVAGTTEEAEVSFRYHDVTRITKKS